MQFSAMTINMFFPNQDDDPADDQRIIKAAVEQSVWFAGLGYNPWYTDHHFRGPWHSNPIQFAAYVAPQIPRDRYLGFGVLSIPFYHPVRLVESMNLLDQLTEGKALFGLGSGWQGRELAGLGVPLRVSRVGPGRGRFARRDRAPLELSERGSGVRVHGREQQREHRQACDAVAVYQTSSDRYQGRKSRSGARPRRTTHGWPAFLGVFGSDIRHSAAIYRRALAAANHPADVVETCLRWCTVDWISVTVADTDAEALKAREKLAQAEQLEIRKRFVSRFGKRGWACGDLVRPQVNGQLTRILKAAICARPSLAVRIRWRTDFRN